MEKQDKRKMFLILKREWEALDASGEKRSSSPVSPGRHEVEIIKSPYGGPDNWLVLKGTKIGGPEKYWRGWKGKDWGKFEVIIEEE